MEEAEIVIHTDGGARGNPGPAACAFIAEMGGKLLIKESKFIGRTTNNFAEYQGVILALDWLSSVNEKWESAIFFLDSELVVKHLTGQYKLKSGNLIKLFFQIRRTIDKTGKKVIFKNVPRKENKIADLLVNAELDSNI